MGGGWPRAIEGARGGLSQGQGTLVLPESPERCGVEAVLGDDRCSQPLRENIGEFIGGDDASVALNGTRRADSQSLALEGELRGLR